MSYIQLLQDVHKTRPFVGVTRLIRKISRLRKRCLHVELASFRKEMISGEFETVYRKDGVKLDPRLERIRKRKEEMKKMEEDEQFMQWGRG